MRNLGAKLALLKKSKRVDFSPHQTANQPSHTPTDQLCQVLDGELIQTPHGELFVLRREYSLRQRYGIENLGSSLNLDTSSLSQLYQGLEDLRIEKTLFFYTETTGLAGGSGTYAFLVGIGFFENDTFVTEQMLMRDHSDERALLSHFANRLQNTDSLVSFNGRTFDAQLLSTRFAMHRLAEPFQGRSHLDLLHLCRRLWGLSDLPNCRLQTIESEVLGAPRHGDVPGWMIPDLFFDFLRDKNPAPLKGVIEHNRRDILAMVALCSHLHKVLSAESVADPHLGIGLARLWACLHEVDRSDAFFKASLQSPGLCQEAKEKGMIYWARELKRRKKTPSAALLWRRILTEFPYNLEATIELAKWLEHKEKDYRSALVLVECGLNTCTLTTLGKRELEHRASRLRRRLPG